MKKIAISSRFLALSSAVVLSISVMTLAAPKLGAQTVTEPIGSCGFILNKNFGGLGAAAVGYDFPQNYIGIINFDAKTFTGSLNSVKNYQQPSAVVSLDTFKDIAMGLIQSNFSGSYRYQLRDGQAFLTVIPVNGGNTHMLMLDYGQEQTEPSATGVCQKI